MATLAVYMSDLKENISGISTLLFLRLFSFLPWPVIDGIAYGLGHLAYYLLKSKRHIAKRNIELCFPSLSAQQVQKMAKTNFVYTATSGFEFAKFAWARQPMVDRWIDTRQMSDLLELDQTLGRPIIIAMPHLTTTYSLGMYLGSQMQCASIYHPPKNKWIKLFFLTGLGNDTDPPKWFQWLFGCKIERSVKMYPHRRNMGGVLRSLRKGINLIYLPDQDMGMDKNVLFPPFFGVPAATVTALHDFVRLSNAAVITCALLRTPKSEYRYTLLVNELIEGLGDDRYEDVAKLTSIFEGIILTRPADYFWLHRRFKTRPPDAPESLY